MITRQSLRAMAVMVIPVLFGFGPCGPIAGGALEGEVEQAVIKDFRFVQDVEHCALEVNQDKPHSVTVNCWAVGKQLFIGCQDCDGKTWSSAILDNPMARVKIGEKLYPVKATRMQDQGAIERAWRFRWEKYEEGEPESVPAGYWLFHMGSVGSA
ncbi:MAG: hypothetical protein ACE37D_10355 [Pseudomonadales bacterium]